MIILPVRILGSPIFGFSPLSALYADPVATRPVRKKTVMHSACSCDLSEENDRDSVINHQKVSQLSGDKPLSRFKKRGNEQ